MDKSFTLFGRSKVAGQGRGSQHGYGRGVNNQPMTRVVKSFLLNAPNIAIIFDEFADK